MRTFASSRRSLNDMPAVVLKYVQAGARLITSSLTPVRSELAPLREDLEVVQRRLPQLADGEAVKEVDGRLQATLEELRSLQQETHRMFTSVSSQVEQVGQQAGDKGPLQQVS